MDAQPENPRYFVAQPAINQPKVDNFIMGQKPQRLLDAGSHSEKRKVFSKSGNYIRRRQGFLSFGHNNE